MAERLGIHPWLDPELNPSKPAPHCPQKKSFFTRAEAATLIMTRPRGETRTKLGTLLRVGDLYRLIYGPVVKKRTSRGDCLLRLIRSPLRRPSQACTVLPILSRMPRCRAAKVPKRLTPTSLTRIGPPQGAH